ncbi:putative peptidase (DUF1758) domain-containing protein [Phthorimaea operculella]|nr:putative peptidase (DUF1758) domain-containing protein [Phthorimaea operculella]
MEELKLQEKCFESIKSICSNYSKDTITRKTVPYLKLRLESLLQQWKDFEQRDIILKETIEDKDITYFNDKVFEKTQTMYEETKLNMQRLLADLRDQQDIKFDLSGMIDDTTEKTLETLITKQECNFKALHRVDTDAAGPIVAHLMSLKLDATSFDDYIKEARDPRGLPNITELVYFLEGKFMALEPPVAYDELEVLLTTIYLQVKTVDGTYVKLRAFLDQGSQVNLVSVKTAQLLRLPRQHSNATISGIGSTSENSKGRLQLSCKSLHTDYQFDLEAEIVQKLTKNLPSKTFKKQDWPHLQCLTLADPDYNISRSIDLLLGAKVYSQIIADGVLKGNENDPIAQRTHLGWMISGGVSQTFNCHMTLVDLNKMTKFWEIEDITQNDKLTNDDQCETFYAETVRREMDGKYTVKMPLIHDAAEKLGNSKSIAIAQFLQQEKRFQRQKKLAEMYKQFIHEYIELGHMKLAYPVTNSTPECFLTHHGVLREQSDTTKLRVVYNAAQPTSSGHSLNSVQLKGRISLDTGRHNSMGKYVANRGKNKSIMKNIVKQGLDMSNWHHHQADMTSPILSATIKRRSTGNEANVAN